MQRYSWKLWAAAGLSAGLLELPFPLAGPLPVGRSVIAWFALAPLLWAVLSATKSDNPHPLRHPFALAYACGVLWYAGNCYWIYDTMRISGGLSPIVSALMLVGFSLVLGLYFGLFGLAVAFVRQRTANTSVALISAPFFWAALELAASRITSVPWDQLGYSQVDNTLVNQLAPFTGVYGISFVLVAVNALLVGGLLLASPKAKAASAITGLVLCAGGAVGVLIPSPRQSAPATAVLLQPNLDVTADNVWQAQDWNQHIAEFSRLSAEQCKTYIAGIPQTGAPNGEILCPPYPTHPDLVAWPEAPAPFVETDSRFQQALASIALFAQSPLIVGNVGADYSADEQVWRDYNSALIIAPDGTRIGRYDKIHLVPFGEYIPFKNLLFFAHKLTGRVSEFTRGTDRKVFLLRGSKGVAHRYGIFICYEAVFADEVREFARNGAEVLVNISDDGWYGDTSAPWQHFNMARMRAIENRRWILRDTNNGITAAIDPYGFVRQSIPRHQVDALPAQFDFRSDVTFYTAHGDIFAWCCAILALGFVAWAARFRTSPRSSNQVRS